MSLRKTNIPVTKIQNIEVTSFEINVDKLKYRLTTLFPKVHAKTDWWSILLTTKEHSYVSKDIFQSICTQTESLEGLVEEV